MIGRAFVIVLTGVAYVIALGVPASIFGLAIQYAFTGYAALAPLLIGALYWRGSTKWGALASTTWVAFAVTGIAVFQHTVCRAGRCTDRRLVCRGTGRARANRGRNRHARLPAGRAGNDHLDRASDRRIGAHAEAFPSDDRTLFPEPKARLTGHDVCYLSGRVLSFGLMSLFPAIVRTGCLLTLCVVWFAATGVAQTVRGSLDGIVRDPSGAIVPGAQMTLTHPETNRTRSTTTDGRGEFIFGPLSPGTYALTIERAGFEVGNHSFTLRLNQNVRIEHELSLQGADDVVDVIEGELLQVHTASRSTVIDSRQVTQLPLDGRNFFELSLLAPGSAPAADGSAGSARGDFAIHVSGGREDSNVFLLDGVYNGDPKLNGVGITPPVGRHPGVRGPRIEL